MIKKAVKTKKYFAPQNDNKYHKCCFEGCDKAGEYKAPKDKNLKEYLWFCLEHVQAYNAKWNYYGDEPEEESKDSTNPKEQMHFKSFRSKIKYNFGYNIKDDFEFFGDYASSFSSKQDVYFNGKEKAFLKTMELETTDSLTLAKIKKQYKKLAKKYHPDLHKDNKEMEEKFKNLSAAYQALLAKFS